RIVNVITACRCSLWTPMAAAWIAPAPIDATAAAAAPCASVDAPVRARGCANNSRETAVITPPLRANPSAAPVERSYWAVRTAFMTARATGATCNEGLIRDALPWHAPCVTEEVG